MKATLLAMWLSASMAALLGAEETLDTSRIPQLIEQLADKDPQVRGGAADALAPFRSEAKSAVPALVALLSDYATYGQNEFGLNGLSANRVRYDAFRALSSIGSESVAALTLALQNDNPPVRDLAIDALREIGPKAQSALKTLISVSKDSDPDEREQIIRAMSAIDKQGDETLPTLLLWLTDGNTEIRRSIAESLGSYGNHPKRVVHTLLRCLDDDEPIVRGHAARSLGKLCKSADVVVPALMRRMTDEGEYQECCGCGFCLGRTVASDAIAALGQFGEESGIAGPQLVELLASEADFPLPRSIAHLLGRLGSAARPLVPRLIEILNEPKVDVNVRVAVLEVFRDLGPEARDAIPAIKQMLSRPYVVEDSKPDFPLECAFALVCVDQNQVHSKDAWERILAELQRCSENMTGDHFYFASIDDLPVFRVIARLGQRARPAAPVLRKMLEASPEYSHGRSEQVALILAKIDPEADGTIKMLVRELGQFSDYEIPLKAALLEFGKPAIESLVNGLTEFANKPDHCISILNVLGEFGERADSAIPAIIDFFTDERLEVRAAAAKTIGKIGTSPKASVRALAWLLEDKRPAVREQAALGLAAFKDAAKSAVPKVTELLNDEYIDVRAAARSALESLQ